MSNTDITHISGESLHAQIQDITVKDSVSLASVDLLFGRDVYQTHWLKKDDTLQTTVHPLHSLSNVSSFTLRLHYRRRLRIIPKGNKNITIDTKEFLSELKPDGEEMHEWRRVYGGTEIIIKVQMRTMNDQSVPLATGATELPSTTHNITSICPQFRILVIGKSGAGKSSLVNAVFGVPKAQVSHFKPGEAEITKEITSEKNERLILHDSRGFEPGEVDNVKIVQQFIQAKNKQLHVKDKLHAVWLCFEIPRAGSRVMETGLEEFLRSKLNGELSTIPVIAVFTKYDKLVGRVRFDIGLRLKGLSKEEILDVVENDAQKRLQEACIEPFEKFVKGEVLDVTVSAEKGREVPHVTVSTEKGYEDTVDKLVKLTFSSVEKHVAREPSVTVAMAQLASPSVKIDACILVGKTKYWKSLASGPNFLGKSLKACLEVIHVDIVTVWNFDDPHRHLRSTLFQNLMHNLVNDLTDQKASNPSRTLSVGLSMLGTMAGIVSALAGPAAPIVIPIVASAVLAVWLYQVYQQSNDTLRRLMAYIVDLTLIMQNLYWLVVVDRRPITRRLIKLAFKTYEESPQNSEVHGAIRDYVERAGFVEHGRDHVLEKIVKLIDCNRIESAEMHSLMSGVGGVNFSGDEEPWVVGESVSR